MGEVENFVKRRFGFNLFLIVSLVLCLLFLPLSRFLPLSSTFHHVTYIIIHHHIINLELVLTRERGRDRETNRTGKRQKRGRERLSSLSTPEQRTGHTSWSSPRRTWRLPQEGP